MGNLLKQAQEMQRQLDQVREALKLEKVVGTGGGGVVRVEVNGEGEVLSIHIDESVATSADKAMIEDLVLAALRDGIGQAHRLRQEKLGAVTGGMNLPGIF
ncbi:MAG: DNA-binding YbaB/EbfC family protein [Candidatus Paceibacteria bacterium]|jgi:DNA-binding YbaB/EbfC family protein